MNKHTGDKQCVPSLCMKCSKGRRRRRRRRRRRKTTPTTTTTIATPKHLKHQATLCRYVDRTAFLRLQGRSVDHIK
jgi:hypothetical protein